MKVLLPIDNTEHSRVPVDMLVKRSWPKDVEIKVITAVDKQEAVASAEEFLAPVVKRIKDELPSATVTSEVKEGDSREIILDVSAAWNADLIVMGAHGRKGLSRIVLGSVSQTVLLYGHCSTLIARTENNVPISKIDHILVPVDNSVHSQKAIDWMLQSPWGAGTKIKLLGVVHTLAQEYSNDANPIFTSSIEIDWEEVKKSTLQFLEQTVAKLKTQLPDCEISAVIEEGEVAEQIIKEAANFGAQLIIMGSRGNSGLKKIWLGSVSQEVVLQAPIPVEVIKYQHN